MMNRGGRRTSLRRVVILGVLAALTFVLALLLDRAVFDLFHQPSAERRDWARMFRVCGYVPTWLLVAAALILAGERTAARLRRCGAELIAAVLVAGGLAELLKLAVRRLRPAEEWGAYQFRPFDERLWSTGGLGLPSSHAAVAFAAAFVLWRFFPRAWPVWLVLPIGCGLTRLLDRAHYFSDIHAAAAVAGLGAWIVAVVARRAAGPLPRQRMEIR